MAKVGSVELQVGGGGPSRDLAAAKVAYDKGDAAASKAAHDVKVTGAPEKHGG